MENDFIFYSNDKKIDGSYLVEKLKTSTIYKHAKSCQVS